jgi:hypothetical protein
MMKISRKTGAALVAFSLLGATALARADEALTNWPQGAGMNPNPAAEKRPVDRAEKTIYVPAGVPDSYHWTGARAADDLYNWPLRAAAEKRPADRAASD